MSLTYGFFDAVYDSDSGTYDRTYTAEQFSTYLKGIISDGVVANVGSQLAVTPHSGMTIQVGTGRMFINSRWMDNDTVIDLTVGAANGALPRKDIVVARLDYSGRAIGITVKAGTAAATPTAPSVQRDSTYYEMELAEINVKARATAITAADITDKRADQTVCGYVVGLVDQIDTAGMWSQLESDFGAWFDEMKDQLSEDAAGNLQNEIDDITDDVETIDTTLTSLVGKVVKTTLYATQTYAHATSGTNNFASVPGIRDYAVVLVLADCGNCRQWLTFVNGDTVPLYLYDYSGNNSIRGGYMIDWANQRVAVRYLQRTGAFTYKNVSITKVVGFIKQ